MIRGIVALWMLLALACGGQHRAAPVSPPPKDSTSEVAIATTSATADAAPAPSDALGACRDNLCGYDSYCSCSGPRENARCWTTAADCEVDAACCAARPGYCNGLRLDDCADATAKARKARDAKPGAP